MASAATSPIEVTVVGGYLGSGKTTLVNHVLRTADSRIAVLVNDFGDINIDADLITKHDGDTLELANGCICCSLVDGFAGALDTIDSLTPRPKRLLVEASGVADPAMVAAYAHAPGFVLDAVVVVVDAERVERSAADKYVGEAVVGQLRSADLLVLNKIDLVESDTADRVRRWLDATAEGAVVVPASHGVVATEILFDVSVSGGSRRVKARQVRADVDQAAPHVDVTSWSLSIDQPLPRGLIEEAMASAPADLIRLKGIVAIAGEKQRHILQRVGPRWSLQPDDGDELVQPARSEIVALAPADSLSGKWLHEKFRSDTL